LKLYQNSRWCIFRALIAAVDFSKSFRYIGVVVAEEQLIKQSSFLDSVSWAKHIADLAKQEKIVYLHRLPHRLAKIHNYLMHIKHFPNLNSCNNFIQSIKPIVIIVDDKLYNLLTYKPKAKESKVKERHRKILTILADNVAYYAYWAIEIMKKLQLL